MGGGRVAGMGGGGFGGALGVREGGLKGPVRIDGGVGGWVVGCGGERLRGTLVMKVLPSPLPQDSRTIKTNHS